MESRSASASSKSFISSAVSSLVFFGLLKFNLAGGKREVSPKDISVEAVSLLGSLFACSCRDKLD